VTKGGQFQSTRPRGARPQMSAGAPWQDWRFNPRAREGRDDRYEQEQQT